MQREGKFIRNRFQYMLYFSRFRQGFIKLIVQGDIMVFRKKSLFFKVIHLVLVFFLAVLPLQAQPLPSLNITSPTQTVQPLMLKGVMIDRNNPFHFDFVINQPENVSVSDIQDETTRLVKFFLTSVAISDKNLWVNLSPLEPDRVIPDVLGQTEMGKILLEQDAVLKQLTARLMSPESESGQKLWEKFSNQQLIETFNKVWIVPGESVIVQDGSRAFIQSSGLKVMLESDYLMQKEVSLRGAEGDEAIAEIASSRERQAFPGLNPMKSQSDFRGQKTLAMTQMKDLIRQIVLPVIEREVNESAEFAPLRQVFHSHLLAVWYKNYLRQSMLNQVYADQQKISGIETDPSFKEQVYQQYLRNFQQGAFDVIREDYDPQTQQLIARQYFSGGVQLLKNSGFQVQAVKNFSEAMLSEIPDGAVISFRMDIRSTADRAMLDPAKTYVGVTANGTKAIIGDQVFLSKANARYVADLIKKNSAQRKWTILGLPTGSSPIHFYEELVRITQRENIDWSWVKTFNMDEYFPGMGYVGDWAKNSNSYMAFMEKHLFQYVRWRGLRHETIHIFNGQTDNPQAETEEYERALQDALVLVKAGQADAVQFGGVGANGHMAFNEEVIKLMLGRLKNKNIGRAYRRRIRDNNDFWLPQTQNPDAVNVYENAIERLLTIHDEERHSDRFAKYLFYKMRKERSGKKRVFSLEEVTDIAKRLQTQKQTIFIKGLNQSGLKTGLDLKLKQLKEKHNWSFEVEILDADDMLKMRSREVHIAIKTIIANCIHFDGPEDINGKALSIGTGTILDMSKVMIFAWGTGKVRAVAEGTRPAKNFQSESTLNQIVTHHQGQVFLFLDHAAAQGIEFVENSLHEINDQSMDISKMADVFSNLEKDRKIQEVYFKKNRKGKLDGLIWRRKGMPEKVGDLNIQDFPEGAKVLVFEFDRGDADLYLPGHMQMLKDVYPDDAGFNTHVRRIKISKHDGRTVLGPVNIQDLLAFVPDVVITPAFDRDERLAKLVELLASQREGGIGIEEYLRKEDRFSVEPSEIRIPLKEMAGAEGLKNVEIPRRPNVFTFIDQQTAELSVEIMRIYESQMRTPFDKIVALKQKLSALLGRYFGADVTSSWADMGVFLEYDFKTDELVYRKGIHQFVYSDDENDQANPFNIILNQRSKVFRQSPHPDDVYANNDGQAQNDLAHGIRMVEMVQDYSGKSAHQGSYEEGSKIRMKENIAAYTYNLKRLGYSVQVESNENPITGELQITLTAFDAEEVKRGEVIINHLAAVYGKNKPENSEDATGHEKIIQMMLDLIKGEIIRDYEVKGKLSTVIFEPPHKNDLHNRHEQFFYRTMDVVLFRLARDKEFGLKEKVERLGFNLYLSSWAGDEEQTYVHFTPSVEDEKMLEKSAGEILDYEVFSAMELIRQKMLALGASSELTAPNPGGSTYGPEVLGGSAASRSRRKGVKTTVLEPKVTQALWHLFIYDHPRGGLDFELLKTVAAMVIRNKKDEPLEVLNFGPLKSDVEFWDNEELQGRFHLNIADMDSSKIEVAIAGHPNVGGVSMRNRIDIPGVESGSVNIAIDFFKNGTRLRPDHIGGEYGDAAYQDGPMGPAFGDYLDQVNDLEKTGGLFISSGGLRTNEEPEYQHTSMRDGLGAGWYHFLDERNIATMYADAGFEELIVPDGLIDRLNALKDGGQYEVSGHGSFIVRRANGVKKAIYIVIGKKTKELSVFREFREREGLPEVQGRNIPVTKSSADVQPVGASVDVAQTAPGGIDLGYGDSIKVKSGIENDDFEKSDDIMRLRQNLKGIIPVPVGSVIPLKEFLSIKN